MKIIVVAGAVANKYLQGGEAWVRLNWILGFRKLGCRVFFLEEIAPSTCVDQGGAVCPFSDCVNLAYFRSVSAAFGLEKSATLIYDQGKETYGLGRLGLIELARQADLLVNISGHLTCPDVLSRFRCKAYIDIDPGFTQFWHADPRTAFTVNEHDHYFTIGENIGTSDCVIPAGGIPWRAVRQPVVLEEWPVVRADAADRFTTIASWRGPFGPVQHDGKTFGLKVHEFRKFIDLPGRVPGKFEIALNIHNADEKDRLALLDHGWRLVNPRDVASDPLAFRRYVQDSSAEFSVAQGIYVDTNSGWFSDRTVRYLASGKPALVQDTGFGRNIPTGNGLLAFRTLDEAVAGADRIMRDYDRHCRAARGIADEYFDSDKALGQFLGETIGGC